MRPCRYPIAVALSIAFGVSPLFSSQAHAADPNMSDYLHAGYKVIGVATSGTGQSIYVLQKDGGMLGETVVARCVYDRNGALDFCEIVASSK